MPVRSSSALIEEIAEYSASDSNASDDDSVDVSIKTESLGEHDELDDD